MSIRAVALHESVFEKRLEALHTPGSDQVFYHSTLAHCKNCRKPFIVLLRTSSDPRNEEYAAELEKRISEDCKDGNHHLAEIQLNVDP